jgi:rhodanese-related sulfurtransferase
MFRSGHIPTISAREAHDRLAADAEGVASRPILLDVREPGEFGQLRAEGAALVSMSSFMARHLDIPKDRSILVICQSGARSQQVAAFLLGNGWTDVVNIAGGTLSWAAAGLPVRRGPLAPGEGNLGS